ncbi:hypothetical protein BH10PSE12_BH10PSE12_05640 [soil metagenome]
MNRDTGASDLADASLKHMLECESASTISFSALQKPVRRDPAVIG